ncbi:MAG: hypothetical protein J4F49_11070 [Rhodobacteraceae bacterium]|nr:hypothetical protein [Paracoccaceae bacterium]
MENEPTGARPAAPVRRSAEEWQEILCDFEASGETAKSYCATRGLSRKTLSKWRSQLNNTASAPAFVAVHPPEPSPTGWDIELELGNGLVLWLKQR